MSKTLTVRIENLSDAFLEKYWKDAKVLSIEEIGMEVPETDTIEIDGKAMMEQFLDGFVPMMGAIAVGHVLKTADKHFNT